jgi:patatin-like phospholipase/acyl hydrolase
MQAAKDTTWVPSFVIISIDGGGIRGLVPALLLQEIEKQIGKPIYKYTDLLAGTSTGGIISTGLSVGMSASDMVWVYTTQAKDIFKMRGNYWDTINRDGALQSRYDNVGLRETLKTKISPDLKVKDAKTHLAITSCLMKDSDHPCGFVFSKSDPGCLDYSLIDVCVATSAAPLYFPSYCFGGNRWVDGGVVANNPSVYAHAEASLYVDNPKTDILHISLSTGYDPGDTLVDEGKNIDSSLFWAANVSSVSIDGTRRMTTMATARFYKQDDGIKRFYRFNPIFAKAIPLDGLEFSGEMKAAADLLI